MRKAITPIIAIIILLLITMSLAASAWLFLSVYAGGMTSKLIQQSYGSEEGNTVMITNIGEADIHTDELTVLVSNEPAQILNPQLIEEGGSAFISFEAIQLGQVNVKFVAPGNSFSYNVDINPEGITGLAAHWAFDGGSMADSTGSNNGVLGDGTCMKGSGACPSVTDGKAGDGLQFDGNDDYARIPSQIIGGSDEITIAFWLSVPVQESNYRRILSDEGGIDVFFTTDGTNGLYGYVGDSGSGGWLLSNEDLTGGVWNHVVLTASASDGKVYSYINGNPAGDNYNNVGFTSATIDDLFIGSGYDLAHKLSGSVDELMVFSRVLTEKEISALHAWAS